MDEDVLGPVVAPYYPKSKAENWWIVIGNGDKNQLTSIKRVALQAKASVQLDFVAPDPGHHTYTLSFMCDSYTGCDQEYDLAIKVGEAEDVDEGSVGMDEDDGDAK